MSYALTLGRYYLCVLAAAADYIPR